MTWQRGLDAHKRTLNKTILNGSVTSLEKNFQNNKSDESHGQVQLCGNSAGFLFVIVPLGVSWHKDNW